MAAEEFARANKDVDYFPSYDMIAVAPRTKAYLEDHVHVTDQAVGEVVGMFLRSHGIPAECPNFREGAYLEANPDVEQAVREGELVSGFHHWRSYGEKEGRPLNRLT